MSRIVIVAINARYTHTSLGARFLRANLGELREASRLVELNINEPIEATVEAVVAGAPGIIGVGVYIWNRAVVEELMPLVRERLPESSIVLGGPEISHDTESGLACMADHVICGEADICFRQVCEALLAGDEQPHIIRPPVPTLAGLILPYDEYGDEDLAHRAVYVESSRGCLHRCEYCLSALDEGVRSFPEEELHRALGTLIAGGVRNLRFVDRSFNLGGARASRLLDFLLPLCGNGLCVHLELTPDELGPAIRERLAAFPAGALHAEVGIQTLDPGVSARIGRPMDPARVEEGVRFLVEATNAAVHADLIAGLPGETPESFAAGFDALYSWGPDEIQVGILKKLHGAPIARHDRDWEMAYRPTPPYDVLETATMPASFLGDVTRFAAHWERVVNRHHAPKSVGHMLEHQPWKTFDRFSRALVRQHGLHGLGLVDLYRELLAFMTTTSMVSEPSAKALLRDDYLASGRRRNLPAFLRDNRPGQRA